MSSFLSTIRPAMLCVWLAALVPIALVACGMGRCGEPPNILLVTLDTTRVDRLGPYGFALPTTPRLDKLAREATVFERAYSTSSWTLPAHASLFTGKFPWSHGARLDPDGPLSLHDGVSGPRFLTRVRARGLAQAERTLAEDLRDSGYATGAVVGGPWLKRVFGLAQGFDYWDDSAVGDLEGADARTVTDRALAWIRGQDREPFFLFLNYFDPHEPYTPPPIFASRFPDAPYEAEIAYADHQLGRVFDHLEERGLWDRTVVVITSDHGELFGEHGVTGHNRYLFEPLIRVPLIVKPAGPSAGSRVSRPIQIVEVPRIVLEAAGLDAPARKEYPIYAEVYPLKAQTQKHHGQWRALFNGNYKFLWNSWGAHRLHEVVPDPGETTNLFALEPERAAAMQQSLESFHTSLSPPPKSDAGSVDPETRRALKTLGYLD